MSHVESQFTEPVSASSLPSGQVMSLHAVLQQRADHERIVVAVRKLREKCFAVTEDDLREIEGRFMQDLYTQDLAPHQWYKAALAIIADLLAPHFKELARTVNQILFVSSRFHFSEAPQPEILSHYELGENIPKSIAHAQLSFDEHTMHDIPGYLENRLGSTLVDLMRDQSVGIEIFI